MKDIIYYPKNKISLDQLEDWYHITDYFMLVDVVYQLIAANKIEPIKNSKRNGKKPALYMAYRILRENKVNEKRMNELQYLAPELHGEYYRNHLDVYEEDRELVQRLNQYLIREKDRLKSKMSVNERSFEVFYREKCLLKEGGARVVKNLGFSLEQLNCYETSQPLAYYSHKKNEGQVMLIIENKDTFYSMRKHLLDGKNTIFGIEIGTLIYGGGKAIYRSFLDFEVCVEPYMRARNNMILYCGDIDYEGILIYEQLSTTVENKYEIKPFVEAYECMLHKASGLPLPDMKTGQNQNCGELFFSYFTGDTVNEVMGLLKSGKYIPQEIMQCKDF